MSNLVYLSRSFVEFGPFTPQELLDFSKRGIPKDIHHIHQQGRSAWLTVADWLKTQPAAPATASAKTAKAKSAAPKTPAKKAAAKPAVKAKPAARKGKAAE